MLRNKNLSEHVLLVVFARRRAHSAPHADDEHEHAEHVGEIKIFLRHMDMDYVISQGSTSPWGWYALGHASM